MCEKTSTVDKSSVVSSPSPLLFSLKSFERNEIKTTTMVRIEPITGRVGEKFVQADIMDYTVVRR